MDVILVIFILIIMFIISLYNGKKKNINCSNFYVNKFLKSNPAEDNHDNIKPLINPIKPEINYNKKNKITNRNISRKDIYKQLDLFIENNLLELFNIFDRLSNDIKINVKNGKENLVLGFNPDGLYNFTISYSQNNKNYDTLWNLYSKYINFFLIDETVLEPLYVKKFISSKYGTFTVVYHLVIAKLNGIIINSTKINDLTNFKLELLVSVIDDNDAIKNWSISKGLRCNYVINKSSFNTRYCSNNLDIAHKIGININWYINDHNIA